MELPVSSNLINTYLVLQIITLDKFSLKIKKENKKD